MNLPSNAASASRAEHYRAKRKESVRKQFNGQKVLCEYCLQVEKTCSEHVTALLKRIDELEQLLEESVSASVTVAVAVPLDNESDSEGEDSDL